MSAGAKYEYLWQDGNLYKKPTRLSAPAYVERLLTWTQAQLDDEAIFPSKIGVPFPKNFQAIIKQIHKRLFRVYAHIYHHHFAVVTSLGEEAHLNTSFKHFVYFVTEFDLVERKELNALEDLVDPIFEQQKQTAITAPMPTASASAPSPAAQAIKA